MEATQQLYLSVRSHFPEIAHKADREYSRYWDDMEPQHAYSWFQSLANALNAQMCKGVNPEHFSALFIFISNSLENCPEEIHTCIDVSFTENLFWQVPGEKAEPYWYALPEPLKQLYLSFHRHVPFQ
ncbi:MAG: DUF7674 family protein [Pseudomonas sp.]|uniref:DUF7674 family protein n=1 Tax=Pseudomonas sp. TaxID=306 RepID=UPI003D0D2EFB